MKKQQKRYTCYLELDPELEKAEGAIVGSKEEVLAWMKKKFGRLSQRSTMMSADAFFYDGDCEEFWLKDGSCVFLAELLEDDSDS